MRRILHCFTLAAIAAATAASSDARAQVVGPLDAAVSRCQPALPAFDGLIRKRPLAVVNEGNGPAFVTCGFQGDVYAFDDNGLYQAVVRFTNATGGALSVSCTLVAGSSATVEDGFLTKSRSVAAGATQALVWSGDDYGDGRFGSFAAVSCNLPPGLGIANIYGLNRNPP